MSNLIVDGYSGIIAPPNLLTNGAFRIDQRNTPYGDNHIPIKIGDYVADCWKVHSVTNVDYLSYMVHPNNGWVGLKGYGKKGQEIVLENKDMQGLGHMYNTNYTTGVEFTAWMGNVQVRAGSIPFKAQLHYMYNSSIFSAISNDYTYYKPGDIKPTKPTIYNTDNVTPNTPSAFKMILEADGEYDMYIYQANAVLGAFKNPPQFAPVPYADDLARCQRYYQTGYYTAHQKAMQYDTNHAIFEERVGYTVPMVSLPTRSFELQLIESLTGSAGVKNDRTSSADGVNKLVTTINGTNDSLAVYMSWLDGTFAQEMYNFGFSLAGAWTAEVV